MGPFGSNKEEGIVDAHRVTQTDHGEASAAVRRGYMGYTRGGRSAGGSGNAVRDDLYRYTAGKRGTLGGFTTTIWSV